MKTGPTPPLWSDGRSGNPELMSAQPTRVEKHSPTEMRLDWNSGESFAVGGTLAWT